MPVGNWWDGVVNKSLGLCDSSASKKRFESLVDGQRRQAHALTAGDFMYGAVPRFLDTERIVLTVKQCHDRC